MDDRDLKRQLQAKRKRLEKLKPYVQSGVVVEFGCGSGFVLEFLSEIAPNSHIIGVDRLPERLAAVSERGLHNVVTVCADVEDSIFPEGVFDTAVFINCLHEIFSEKGREGVMGALQVASTVLRRDGVVLIQDYLKPEPQVIEMEFADQWLLKRFMRFAKEFKPRQVNYEMKGSTARLDVADAFEFITKHHAKDEEHWQEEMRETHLFFTEEDFRQALREAGLNIVAIERIKGAQAYPKPVEGLKLNPPIEVEWIQVIGKKPVD